MRISVRLMGGFLVVLMLLLAACGGTSGDDVIPPTRVDVGDAQPQTTPPTPDANAQSALPTAVMPSGDVTAEVTEAAPPPLPSGPLPSAGVNGTPPAPSPEAVVDFSTLVLGDRRLVAGTLNIQGEGAAQMLILTDANDLTLQVNTPANLLPNLIGTQIEIFGTIYDANVTPTGDAPQGEVTSEPGEVVLAIRPESISPVGVGVAAVPAGMPGFLPESTDAPEGFPLGDAEAPAPANVPPFMQGTLPAPPVFGEGTAPAPLPGGANPFGPGAAQGETLDFTVEPELTTLQAYDALIENIEDEIEGRVWIMARGSRSIGWTFDFYSSEAQDNLSYVVLPSGEVRRIPASPALPFQQVGTFSIDREALVLDSSDVEAYVTSLGGPPVGEPQLILGGNAQATTWTTLTNTTLILVATQPIDQQSQLTPTAAP